MIKAIREIESWLGSLLLELQIAGRSVDNKMIPSAVIHLMSRVYSAEQHDDSDQSYSILSLLSITQ
jgi:tryptophan 2,3-dioxygenase